MAAKEPFNSVITNVSRYVTQVERYLISPKEKKEIEENETLKTTSDQQHDFVAFMHPQVEIVWPKISIWEYLEKENLEKFLSLKRKRDIRRHIENKIEEGYPKGVARTVFIELIYNVRKFCIAARFNLEQTGAVLSQFYLTHRFFTSDFYISAEKTYLYFKEMMMRHCLPFLPDNIKLFSFEETKSILTFFHTLYLKNLPLIRFLCLPNFALYLYYELEPEPELLEENKKKGKGKKGDKESKKGGKTSKKGDTGSKKGDKKKKKQ